MRALVWALETTGVSQCSEKGYQDLVDNLKDNVVGLGDLKAAKTVMNFASLGLFIPPNFLSYFSTGSSQQLKNLQEAPFCFERPDQVSQLRWSLCIKEKLLPLQADEYICALLGNKEAKVTIGGETLYHGHSP
jgi:hypothetical protein